MTMTTLGDLFPELNNCRPAKPANKKNPSTLQGRGPAARLKIQLPELEAWEGFLTPKMWMHWGETCGIDLKEPTERDERFMEFLVTFIVSKMLEIESGISVPPRKTTGIDAAFQDIRQTYLDNERGLQGKDKQDGGTSIICH